MWRIKALNDIRNYFIDRVQSFPIKCTMSVAGNPGLSFKHVKTQAMLELNVHKHTGGKVDMLSGTYYIDELSHEINETNFITNMSLRKWYYDIDEEMKPRKIVTSYEGAAV
jgi:hypothetical protein